MDRSRPRGQPVVGRADAACAIPALYEALARRGVASALRLPAHAVLERAIEDLLVRPRGRPSHAPLVRSRSVQDQAASWDRPRRVIATGEHPLGALLPRGGVLVTPWTGTTRAVVCFSTQRGTAEPWSTEGTEAPHWTRLSCPRVRAHEGRVLVGVGADTLGPRLRRRVLPLALQRGSLTSLQQRLVTTGGRRIRQARYCILQLAERHVTQRLCGQILGRIERLAGHPT